MTRLTLNIVRRALQLPLPGLPAQLRMSPPGRPIEQPAGSTPRDAGVLVLLYPLYDALHFVLTRRTEKLGHHSGQISFPGGRRDPIDIDIAATALREAREELCVDPAGIQILGMLSPLYVPPSNFIMHPVVSFASVAPTFTPQADEVAEVFDVPLARLLDPSARSVVPRPLLSLNGQMVDAPAYLLAGQAVWGATAMVLSEFEVLLRGAE